MKTHDCIDILPQVNSESIESQPLNKQVLLDISFLYCTGKRSDHMAARVEAPDNV